MSAAAARFVSLGIYELVRDFGLLELGDYIARKLEEMTTGKRLGKMPYLAWLRFLTYSSSRTKPTFSTIIYATIGIILVYTNSAPIRTN